jgi:hypothetical protein
MVRYLRDNIKEYKEILADRIIDSTCNLYRPDILYDCGTHIVVVECDENQHKNYPWESCSLNRSLEHMEEKRMYEIMVAYGLPAIFIRWNPDKYKPANENKKQELLKKRHKLCGDLICDIKKDSVKLPIALVAAIYLYYDGWSSLSEAKWHIITAVE